MGSLTALAWSERSQLNVGVRAATRSLIARTLSWPSGGALPGNGGVPGIVDQLTALAQLDQLFERHEVAYWLFGGWAVDFHVGRVTRGHEDIDIAVWLDDRERVSILLLECAWAHRPTPGEDGHTAYERNGIRLEVAFLARDERGHVYTPLRDGRGDWPAGSFGDEVAQLRGVRARVVGRESLIADKSSIRPDAVTAAKDRADVESLLRRRS